MEEEEKGPIHVLEFQLSQVDSSQVPFLRNLAARLDWLVHSSRKVRPGCNVHYLQGIIFAFWIGQCTVIGGFIYAFWYLDWQVHSKRTVRPSSVLSSRVYLSLGKQEDRYRVLTC